MRSITVQARPVRGPLRSRRLLAALGDRRLVEQIRGGNEIAFEVAFERYGPGVLSFCRHMLRSRDEAEDAVQHTFAVAYGELLRDDREIALRPWLYTIARNRCISLLRARRETPSERVELSTSGPAEQVERRADLHALLADVALLPAEQREALLLTEAAGLSHAEVAAALGVEVPRVKALVYRARSSLVERRSARETPCDEIREQLANLRGGALRRNELRHHLHACPACRSFKDEVARQRRMLAAALPVVPSAGLKSSVLAAIGFGQGSAGGGAALAGLGGAVTAAPVGGATLAKVAIVGVIAAGGVTAERVVVRDGPPPASSAAPSAGLRQPARSTLVPAAAPRDKARAQAGLESPVGQPRSADRRRSSRPAPEPRRAASREPGAPHARKPAGQTPVGGHGRGHKARTDRAHPSQPGAHARAHGRPEHAAAPAKGDGPLDRGKPEQPEAARRGPAPESPAQAPPKGPATTPGAGRAPPPPAAKVDPGRPAGQPSG